MSTSSGVASKALMIQTIMILTKILKANKRVSLKNQWKPLERLHRRLFIRSFLKRYEKFISHWTLSLVEKREYEASCRTKPMDICVGNYELRLMVNFRNLLHRWTIELEFSYISISCFVNYWCWRKIPDCSLSFFSIFIHKNCSPGFASTHSAD